VVLLSSCRRQAATSTTTRRSRRLTMNRVANLAAVVLVFMNVFVPL
jgi:hypothetical protein